MARFFADTIFIGRHFFLFLFSTSTFCCRPSTLFSLIVNIPLMVLFPVGRKVILSAEWPLNLNHFLRGVQMQKITQAIDAEWRRRTLNHYPVFLTNTEATSSASHGGHYLTIHPMECWKNELGTEPAINHLKASALVIIKPPRLNDKYSQFSIIRTTTTTQYFETSFLMCSCPLSYNEQRKCRKNPIFWRRNENILRDGSTRPEYVIKQWLPTHPPRNDWI